MGSLVSLLVVLGTLGGAFTFLFLRKKQELQVKELRLRELEAKARLLEVVAESGDKDLPSYIDPRDKQAVAAWQRAKAELGAL
jgi:hypothetical protein